LCLKRAKKGWGDSAGKCELCGDKSCSYGPCISNGTWNPSLPECIERIATCPFVDRWNECMVDRRFWDIESPKMPPQGGPTVQEKAAFYRRATQCCEGNCQPFYDEGGWCGTGEDACPDDCAGLNPQCGTIEGNCPGCRSIEKCACAVQMENYCKTCEEGDWKWKTCGSDHESVQTEMGYVQAVASRGASFFEVCEDLLEHHRKNQPVCPGDAGYDPNHRLPPNGWPKGCHPPKELSQDQVKGGLCQIEDWSLEWNFGFVLTEFAYSTEEETTTYTRPTGAQALSSALALIAYIEMGVTILVILVFKACGMIDAKDGGNFVDHVNAVAIHGSADQFKQDMAEEMGDMGLPPEVATQMKARMSDIEKAITKKVEKKVEDSNAQLARLKQEHEDFKDAVLRQLNGRPGDGDYPNLAITVPGQISPSAAGNRVSMLATANGNAELLPPGWFKKESRSKPGRFYYYHEASNTSQVERPAF